MKKHDKKRIQGIKQSQKVAKAYKHFRETMVSCKDERGTNDGIDAYPFVVRKLSNRDLKAIADLQGVFSKFDGSTELQRLANDELADRALKLSK